MEEGITGICENIYDITPIENDRRLKEMARNLCPKRENHMRITKTRNFDNCQKLPIFNYFAPAGWRCSPGAAICERSQSRSLIQRYEICQSEDTHLEILEIELFEDFFLSNFGARSVFQMSKIRQKFRLKSKKILKNPLPIPNHVFDHSLLYNYEFRKIPMDQKVQGKQICQDIKSMYRHLFNQSFLKERNLVESHLKLMKSLEILHLQQGMELAHLAHQELSESEWSLFIYELSSTGTLESVHIIKQLIVEKKLSKQDTIQVISTWTMFLKRPNRPLLYLLLSFLELDFITQDDDLRQTTMVSLASVIRLVCVDKKMLETRFPTHFYGSFCDGELRNIIPRRLVHLLSRYLHGNTSNGDRIAALSALNTLGHPALIPVVVPVIQGKLDMNPSLRTKAILTLHKLSHGGHQKAIEILQTVYGNPSENYQVRIAAFTLYMLSNPADSNWINVAIRTWFEPRSHVTTFVYTTLSTLAQLQSPIKFLRYLSEKAKMAIKYAKPVAGGVQFSANYIWSFSELQRHLGSYLRLETFANKASLFPKDLYGRFNFNLGAIDLDFIEFDIHNHQLEWVFNHFFSMKNPLEMDKCLDQDNVIDLILNQLNVTYHSINNSELSLHWTLMESVERFHSVDFQQLFTFITEWTTYNQNHTIQWYQLLPLVHVQLLLPNSMGFLTDIQVEGLTLFTLNGHFKLLHSTKEIMAENQFNPTFMFEIHTKMAIDSGISSDMEIGYNILNLMTLPGHLETKWNKMENIFQFKWKSIDENNIILYNSQCPYVKQFNRNTYQCPREINWSFNELVSSQTKIFEWEFWRETFSHSKILSALSFFWLPTLHSENRQWSLKKPLHLDNLLFTFQLDSRNQSQQWIRLDSLEVEENLREKSIEKENKWKVSLLLNGATDKSRLKSHLSEKQISLSVFNGLIQSKLSTDIVEKIASFCKKWKYSPHIQDKIFDIETIDMNEQELFIKLTSQLQWKDILPSLWLPRHIAQCTVHGDQVTTFDSVVYDGQLENGCQYLVMASTGILPKFLMLLDRHSHQNQVLHLLLSGYQIEIDLVHLSLKVNGLNVSLEENGGSYIIGNGCHGNGLVAEKLAKEQGLVLDLAYHGFRLELFPNTLFNVQAKSQLRGKIQGLCGDFNEEMLYEFRGPRRCVFSSGNLMAAAYQIKDNRSCHLPLNIFNQLQQERIHCPKHEGKPTEIHWEF